MHYVELDIRPIPGTDESEDQPFAAAVREAKAVTRIAGLLLSTWRAPVQRKPRCNF